MRTRIKWIALIAVVFLLTYSLTVSAQAETPPIEDIMETPSEALNWLVEGGAAYVAGMLVSILCWMSPKFNALPSEKKRRIANIAAMVVAVLAQGTILLFIYKPEYLVSVESVWKIIASIIVSIVGLNVTYLKAVREKPAILMVTSDDPRVMKLIE